jgi:hypothetical protein
VFVAFLNCNSLINIKTTDKLKFCMGFENIEIVDCGLLRCDAVVVPMVGPGGVCIWREPGVWNHGFVLVRLAGIWLQSP